MATLSNELKAVLFWDNFLENPKNVLKENCLVAKELYQRLALNGHYDYSILFNVTYDNNQRLKDYEDGMVVNGYVVSLEERYSSLQDDAGVDKQMLLEVKLLVRSTTYMGRERQNDLVSVFIH